MMKVSIVVSVTLVSRRNGIVDRTRPCGVAGVNSIRMFDTDNDCTLDLAEVKKAASALFSKLDPDHDGTLDVHELRGRLKVSDGDLLDQAMQFHLSCQRYDSPAARSQSGLPRAFSVTSATASRRDICL
jgi:hypothetical protein